MGLRPDASVQKVLISTTCRFYGDFETGDLLVSQAWSATWPPTASARTVDGDASRNSFVCAFRSTDVPHSGVGARDSGLYGELVCICLAVLFGKRFDNHGPLENGGAYLMPDLRAYGQQSSGLLPQNTDAPRVDFRIPLNLTEIYRLEALLTGIGALHETKAARTFGGAGKFYLRALQSVERDPEVAYLNLITAGEILSNFFEYPKAEVLDDTSKKLIRRLREVPDGCKLATHVEGKLRSVKRRFVRTIVDLVDESFFVRTQSSAPFAAFSSLDFSERIAAAYDLRSRYVHTGISFGGWVARPHVAGAEVPLGWPVLDDRKLVKILHLAPTYTGLERVIRYCLLRFAYAHGLINPGMVISTVVEPAASEPAPSGA